jgi:Autographiviridae endonuclease
VSAKPRPLFERWNAKVERTPSCWLWRGAIKDTGYGVIQRGGRAEGLVRAHRFAYEYYVGPIPEGLELRHSCHNRACVNPAHLTPGTRAENMRDMVAAGRWTPRTPHRGETNGFSKLTEELVRYIRSSEKAGIELARELGVSTSQISAVRTRQAWKHIS